MARRMDEPLFLDATVLLCTRDRPGLAVIAIASVLAGDSLPAEIVVVDQSEVPDPSFATTEPPVRYLHRPGVGLARARNVGFRAATRDVVALVDDDMTVDTAWLRSLIDARS